MKRYKYVIVGAGIAGCSVAHFLKEDSVLILDRNESFAAGASGAAGGFLSPLLGKPNKFKTLVSEALRFSVDFYKAHIPEHIINKGVVRIPKNNEDELKFKEYEKHFDFEYEKTDKGYFFPIGSQVISDKVCEYLTENVEKRFSYEIKHIDFKNETWKINEELEAENLILTTGADTDLIDEEYFNIRAVWGQRIDITTPICIAINYHKDCSISTSKALKDTGLNQVAIGATHHRFNGDCDENIYSLKAANINKKLASGYTNDLIKSDTKELLGFANDIIALNEVNVTGIKVGARASSVDYFPMVGPLINSKETLSMFPYLKNGTHVQAERFARYKNLFVLNGVGGRGFVLSPYLAKNLVDFIKNNVPLQEDIIVDRLFKRWVRRQK